jgi:hypothetical protein
MSRDRSGTIVGGLILIGLGIVWALALLVGWDKVWPVFLLLGGLGFLVGYVASGFKEEGFVFVGTLAALVGLFFFGFTLGFWQWEDMSMLWPVFPLIGGVAFFAMFFAGRERDAGVLGVGCAAMLAGAVGLAVTYGVLGSAILKLWPLLLVMAGIIGLAGALLRLFGQE